MADVLVAAGGIIPDADVAKLKEAGVAEIFGPGTSIGQIATLLPGERPAPGVSGGAAAGRCGR